MLKIKAIIIPVLAMFVFAQSQDLETRLSDIAAKIMRIAAGLSQFENLLGKVPANELPRLRIAVEELREERGSLDRDISACRELIRANRLGEAANRLTIVEGKLEGILRKIERIKAEIKKYARLSAERVQKAVERTDRAISRADQFVRKNGGNEDAVAGLRKAVEIQDQAKQALQTGRMKQAYKMTLEAREVLIRTAKNALDKEDIEALVERARQYWAKTNAMIERVEKALDNQAHPRAAEMLAKARELQQKARDAWKAEEPVAAMREARAARRIVAALMAAGRESGNAGDEIKKVEAKLERAARLVQASGNAKALQILEKGREHLQKAREAQDGGQKARAVEQARVAAKLIAKAVDVAGIAGEQGRPEGAEQDDEDEEDGDL